MQNTTTMLVPAFQNGITVKTGSLTLHNFSTQSSRSRRFRQKFAYQYILLKKVAGKQISVTFTNADMSIKAEILTKYGQKTHAWSRKFDFIRAMKNLRKNFTLKYYRHAA